MSEFSVAAVFSNHCVLQRNSIVKIFGTGQNDSVVSVILKNSAGEILCKNCESVKNDRWEIQLSPQSAQNGCTLQITCEKKTVDFIDIAIGEVWLAGGQSNMEFELHSCKEGPAELDANNSERPEVRFYYTNKISWMDEKFYEAEKNTCWQTWDSEWKTAWSAVGYFFAKKLSQELGVTVGVIGCNWGGTSASAWMQKEYLEKDEDLKTYLTEQEEATKGKSIEQQCAEYDEYERKNAQWNSQMAELYAKNPGIEWNDVVKQLGPCLWPGPKSCKNPYRPTGLYDCMLSRIIPYTIKGVIWYQGESDDHKPHMYYKLFSSMIENWRNSWGKDDLPFIFVQLPNHRYKQDKDFKSWCLIREAQAKVHDRVKNAWMTCSMDLGQYNDIHPQYKKQIAERMEKVAAAKVYELKNDSESLAPMIKDALSIEGKMILSFTNADLGFNLREDEKTFSEYVELEKIQGNTVPQDFTGFEIAGNDGVFYPAKFAFGGKDGSLNKIILSSDKVSEPVSARYCWYNYGPVTVYGKNDLPLAPFRISVKTDFSEKNSSEKTEHAEIQQIMTV